MLKFLKGAILFAPFFLFLPLTSQAYTTHLFCECVYTYPEDPAGPMELCPADADVDIYVDADIGFFLKRVRVSQRIFGDSNYHLDRVAKFNSY